MMTTMSSVEEEKDKPTGAPSAPATVKETDVVEEPKK